MIKLLIFLFLYFTLSISTKVHNEQCSSSNECEGELLCRSKPDDVKTMKCVCKTGSGYQSPGQCVSFDKYVCPSDTFCQDQDEDRICNLQKCQCKDGYSESKNDQKCEKGVKVGHNESCELDSQCKGNLYCHPRTGRCICKETYVWSHDSCKPMALYSCSQDSDCQDRDPNRICNSTTQRCGCRNGYLEPSMGNYCVKNKASYNDICNQDSNCGSYLKCYPSGDMRKCLCLPGLKWNSTIKVCYPMEIEYCKSDVECQDVDKNRICKQKMDTTLKYCQCKDNYMPNYESICVLKYGYMQACVQSFNSCQINMTCTSNVCVCSQGFIWSEVDKKCVTFQEGTCTTDIQCENIDKQRVCDLSSGKCVCKQGLISDKTKLCVAKIGLAQPCSRQGQCGPANSFCHKSSADGGVCACKPTHQRKGDYCVAKACGKTTDCYSDIFDEDNNLVCDGKGTCNCATGYSLDLGLAKCKLDSSQGKPNFANTIKLNNLLILFLIIFLNLI